MALGSRVTDEVDGAVVNLIDFEKVKILPCISPLNIQQMLLSKDWSDRTDDTNILYQP